MQKAREERADIGNVASVLRVPSREKGWIGDREKGERTERTVRRQGEKG